MIKKNNDLKEINNWVFQKKLSFNPDLSKQMQEVIFSKKKIIKATHRQIIFFNNIPVSKVDYQKHLGLILDYKLIFDMHIKDALLGLRQFSTTEIPPKMIKNTFWSCTKTT